jgi:hypothetical protein
MGNRLEIRKKREVRIDVSHIFLPNIWYTQTKGKGGPAVH